MYHALNLTLNNQQTPAQCDEVRGLHYLDKVIDIDQSPIGRTPRSNPATYTGLFSYIRDLLTYLSLNQEVTNREDFLLM